MYYLTFIYLFGLVFVEDKIKDKNKIILALIPLIFIVFFRYGVGADYFSYERIHAGLANRSFSSAMSQFPKVEILYKVVNFFALKLGLSYHIFVGLIAGSLTVLTTKWLYNNSPNFFLSVLLHYSMLFFYWNLSALRQGIVLTILLYIYFNENKEYSIKVKLISVIILFFMHASAIIVPIVYLMSLITWDKKKFLILFALSPLSRVIFRVEFLMLFSKLPYVDKVIGYLSYNSIEYLSIPALLRFSFFGLILWHYDSLVKKYPKKLVMVNFALVSLLMYFYLPVSMVIGTRVTIFGYYLTIIIFPMILSLYQKTKLYPIVLVGFLGLSTVSFYNEFDKLIDRTGYMYSKHRLNFETVFNQDRNKFDNMFALHLKIDEENEKWFKNSDLAKRVNDTYYEREVEFNQDMKILSLWFPQHQKYGIINTKGQIVKKPTSAIRNSIYGDVLEYENGFGNFGFKTYRRLGDLSGQYLPYSFVEDQIMTHIDLDRHYSSSKLVTEMVDVSILDNFEFLNIYNMRPVVEIEKYSYTDLNDFSYLRLKTNYSSYYLILKNDDIFVEKIYRTLAPISVKDVIVARTNFSREFINGDGEVFWFE